MRSVGAASPVAADVLDVAGHELFRSGDVSDQNQIDELLVLAKPAGQAFRVTGAGDSLGLDIVLDAGVVAASSHPCVGKGWSERDFKPGPRPSFDGLAQTDAGLVPYELGLGVSAAATHDEVREAYRQLALQTHPDRVAASGEATRDHAAIACREASLERRSASPMCRICPSCPIPGRHPATLCRDC